MHEHIYVDPNADQQPWSSTPPPPLLPSRLSASRLPPHMGRADQDPPPHPEDVSPMCGGGGAPRDQVPPVQAAERLLRLHLAISEEQIQLGVPMLPVHGAVTTKEEEESAGN